jgi:acetaldehyde dehydrogenase (acetylating)
LTGVNSKVILNLNPSNSSIMKTTIYVVTQNENDFCNFDNFVKSVQKYVPKYNVESPVKISSKLYMVHINIIGTGDFISQNYGNLDIINCAAIYALKELCNKI